MVNGSVPDWGRTVGVEPFERQLPDRSERSLELVPMRVWIMIEAPERRRYFWSHVWERTIRRVMTGAGGIRQTPLARRFTYR